MSNTLAQLQALPMVTNVAQNGPQQYVVTQQAGTQNLSVMAVTVVGNAITQTRQILHCQNGQFASTKTLAAINSETYPAMPFGQSFTHIFFDCVFG